jgi:hypothetical protein
MSTIIQVPEKDEKYLRLNHARQSVPEMAKRLKRANATVYKFMEVLGLTTCRRANSSNHPWRKSNKKLEDIFIHQPKENQKRASQANVRKAIAKKVY